MKSTDLDVHEYRKPEYPVEDLILTRWSPRAFSEQEVSDQKLMSVFEAARWAPSSFNGQPWRFFYARRGSKHWDEVVHLMGDFNQKWAGKAAVLLIIFSRKTFEHNDKPSRTHAFDCGAGWENLCLQARANGLITHGMAGFDYDRAHRFLGLSSTYEVHAMAALGYPGNPEDLPESMREREVPSDRKPLSERIFTEPLDLD